MRRSGLLEEWGRWICAHIDFAEEYGESVLYRCSQFGYTEQVSSGHSILCEDMPERLRKTELSVRKLNDLQGQCVRLWYCTPLKEDGNVYSKSELAKILKINKGKFRAELRKGSRKVENLT